MNLINYSGEARSFNMEAIQYGKSGILKKRNNLDNANKSISKYLKSNRINSI